MKSNTVIIALMVINVAVVTVLTVTRVQAQPDVQPVVRANLIELVDSGGQVRGQLRAEANGEVTFRMWDRTGAIRTEFGADVTGSGVAFMDNLNNPGVRIYAGAERTNDRDSGTSIALSTPTGRRNILKP